MAPLTEFKPHLHSLCLFAEAQAGRNTQPSLTAVLDQSKPKTVGPLVGLDGCGYQDDNSTRRALRFPAR